MDDHVYEWLYNYFDAYLFPRFREEYAKENGNAHRCSYLSEVLDALQMLNIAGKYCGEDELILADIVGDLDDED
jgi:hypothetical protein